MNRVKKHNQFWLCFLFCISIVQIIANNATDLIAEAGVLMQLEGTVYDVANTIHAHPTISEIYMESGFDAFDKPIHK